MNSAEGGKTKVLSCYDCPELCSVRNLLAKVTDSLPGGNCINQMLATYSPGGFALKWASNGVKLLANGRVWQGLHSITSLLKIPDLGMGFGPVHS